MLELGTPASLPYQPNPRSLGVPVTTGMPLKERNVLLMATANKSAGL